MSLVELLRDVKPGFNTLFSMDDLLRLNQRMIIFRETPEDEEARRDMNWHRFLEEDKYEGIIIHDKQLTHYYPKVIQADMKFIEELQNNNSLPNLRERINEADYLVVPSIKAVALQELFPDKTVIIDEDPKTPKIHIPVSDNNFPRVLETYKDSFREGKINRSTIDRLFGKDFLSDINDFFLKGMRLEHEYVNPVQRSRITITQPELTLPSWSSWPNEKIYPAREIDIPVNMYGLGMTGGLGADTYIGRQNKSSTVYLGRRRTEKIHDIKELIEGLLTFPLNSIEEIETRQQIYSQMSSDDDFFENISDLEKYTNQMVEPLLHISAMSKLVSTNILRSRWGASIRRDKFYDDFVRIGKDVTELYEQMLGVVKTIDANSTELSLLVAPLQAISNTDNPLNEVYHFLKHVENLQPENYSELRQIFIDELGKRDASLLRELESYDRSTDMSSEKWRKVTDKRRLLLQKFHSQNPISYIDNFVEMMDQIGVRLAAYNAVGKLFRDEDWSKPKIMPADEGILDIKNGWYPLTMKQHGDEIIRNSTYLGPEERVEIIEGINVGGKTVDVKKALLIACLAQTGSFVPAEYAKISFFDDIVFKIKETGMYHSSALNDELHGIQQAIDVLGKNVLLGLDETFSSTNELEGEALTYGLIHRIINEPNARAIITSHYPGLQNILQESSFDGVKFSHFRFDENADGLVFPHKKHDGQNVQGDYAITIGIDQGIPPSIINYALDHLGIQSLDNIILGTPPPKEKSRREDYLDELRSLGIPLDAETQEKIEEDFKVLDKRTYGIIFQSSLSSMGFSGIGRLLPGKDKIIPLTDVEQINDKLDATEVLIENDLYREEVINLLNVYIGSPLTNFFNNLLTYNNTEADDKQKQVMVNSLVKNIDNILRIGDKKGQVKSINPESSLSSIVTDATRIYNEHMGKKGDVRKMYRVFKKMNNEIDDLTSVETVDEEDDPITEKRNLTPGEFDSLVGRYNLLGFFNPATELEEALHSLGEFVNYAEVAIENNLIRPEIVPREDNCLIINGGYWPKTRRPRETDPVPNSTLLTPDNRVEILEGVNSGGKTVDMKKALYIASLALSGRYVPAEYTKVSIRDRIILREKGTGDAISAFQQDVNSVLETNPPEGEYWLIGLDETFTSTERRGGEALSVGTIKHILDQENSLMIMSSHYPNLSHAFVDEERVLFNHFPFEKREGRWGQEIGFPYTKREGVLENYKYGVAVASVLKIGWDDKKFDKKVIGVAKARLELHDI